MAGRLFWRLTAVPVACMCEALLVGVDVAAADEGRWRVAVVARPMIAQLTAPGTPVVFANAGTDHTDGHKQLGVIAAAPGDWVDQSLPIGHGMYLHGAVALHTGFVAVTVTVPTDEAGNYQRPEGEHLLYDEHGHTVTVVPYRALRGRVLAMLT